MLYLDAASADSNDVALADGITEEVITRLSQVTGLRVTSRYAALRYRDRRLLDPRLAGRELGVRYVLQGTLRRSGDRVRVQVAMTDVATGFNAWAQTYDQALRDVFTMQDSVALQVAKALRGQLTGQERARLTPGRLTTSPEAFQAYVRGRAGIRARTSTGAAEAVTQYQRAIALDPGLGAAYAGLAHVYGLAANWGWEIPGTSPESLDVLAARSAARALALDSTSAEAWLGAAMAARFRDPQLAVAFHRRAVALDSTDTEALHQLAWALADTGSFDSALVTEQHVTALDPFYAYAYASVAYFLILRSRPGEALGWAAQGAAIDSTHSPAYWMMAEANILLGRPVEAQAAARRALRLGVVPAVARSLLAEAYATAGDSVAARAQLDSVAASLRDKLERSPSGLSFWEAGYLSAAFAQLGEPDSSLAWLARIRPSMRRLFRGFCERYWAWSPVRGDPRFQSILAEARP